MWCFHFDLKIICGCWFWGIMHLLDNRIIFWSLYRFNPRWCCKSRINCSHRIRVAEPMVNVGSAVESQGTKMYEPNWDDLSDLCECKEPQQMFPIFPRRIPTMWWTIVSRLLAIKQMAMQHIEYYCLDSKRCPKHCMWLRWHEASR